METIDLSLVIINDVSRSWAPIISVLLLLSGCRDRMQNKELVQQAIVKRLQAHSGLDLNSLDVTTTSVSFDKNMAYATVAFHPKGDPGVNSGLVMKYTLQQKDRQWEVVSVGDSRGGTLGGHMGLGDRGGMGQQLPAGHPNVDGLPPGHPQTSETPGQGQASQGQAQ